MHKKTYVDTWDLLADICQYFYENRDFYRKALRIKGQNSFSDHFRELLLPIISNRLQDIIGLETKQEFQINFFADAFVMAFQRWILEYASMSATDFLEQMKICIKYIAARYEELE